MVTAADTPVLAITGPTTSGKTDLSLAIAARRPIEIISMDSRQVYVGMDIGTDKVRDEHRARIPHHGLDLVRPDERYSVGRFGRDARRWIADIRARGRLPVIAGGTGFFLKNLLTPIFAEPSLDPDRRERLRYWLGTRSGDELERMVRALDPARSELAVEGGPQRMARTIEVALLSGVPLSRWHREAPPEADGVCAAVVVLDLPRAVIDRKIADRVERMIERGLEQEVRGLLAAGYDDEAPGMTGTGYREMARYIRGEQSLDEAMEDIRTSTRRYARRQLTWFRHQLPEHAVTIDATLPVDRQAEIALETLDARAARGSR